MAGSYYYFINQVKTMVRIGRVVEASAEVEQVKTMPAVELFGAVFEGLEVVGHRCRCYRRCGHQQPIGVVVVLLAHGAGLVDHGAHVALIVGHISHQRVACHKSARRHHPLQLPIAVNRIFNSRHNQSISCHVK